MAENLIVFKAGEDVKASSINENNTFLKNLIDKDTDNLGQRISTVSAQSNSQIKTLTLNVYNEMGDIAQKEYTVTKTYEGGGGSFVTAGGIEFKNIPLAKTATAPSVVNASDNNTYYVKEFYKYASNTEEKAYTTQQEGTVFNGDNIIVTKVSGNKAYITTYTPYLIKVEQGGFCRVAIDTTTACYVKLVYPKTFKTKNVYFDINTARDTDITLDKYVQNVSGAITQYEQLTNGIELLFADTNQKRTFSMYWKAEQVYYNDEDK